MRDLLDQRPAEYEAERAKVAAEGWGAQILALQKPDGKWGPHVYAKWHGTFYTMLVLRDLGLQAEHEGARRAARVLLDAGHRPNGGGIRFGATGPREPGETCVSGMGMAVFARYHDDDPRMDALCEYLLRDQMPDGGWNCQRPFGATHSSFHTTISVLEGLLEWESRVGGDDRSAEARRRGEEFVFAHRLFRSHRTGEVVKEEFTRFHFPPRWHYDVLRGLDYLQAAGAPCDERVSDAIELVRKRRKADGGWWATAGYSGTEPLPLEKAGQPGRGNTLRCLRVLRWWER
jgi:hypothetical protein